MYGLVEAPSGLATGRGAYVLETLLQPGGGLLGSFRVGLTNYLSLGASYGGGGVIGSGTPDWNPRVEFRAAYQITEESYVTPALAIGFDSQGFGSFLENLDRYQVKSKGFYGAVTKTYNVVGTLALHGGANYSLEGSRENKSVNCWAGAELGLNRELTAVVEYDFGLNDTREKGGLGRGRGYLNVGGRLRYAEGFTLEVDFKDLQENVGEGSMSRTLKIGFGETF
jgi:hypothetical protein